ncbi:MAG: adenosylcobinamide-GDP ribazoletransferase [Mogibacterium sp.]|nr:adenosylcobinamide-GDP ribazoletransferase [Mogibacterium sp.]
MRLLRTIAVTFAQYSRIPIPHFEWEEEDMKYSMSAFPLVGAVIGAVFYGIFRLAQMLELPAFALSLLLTAVPLILTGGFHVDGFMDVSDALSSYGSREDKLRILKDPHIGAFAVIRLAICGLIYIASLDIVLAGRDPAKMSIILAAGFAMARGLSAIGVLNFRAARNEGMLFYEASCAGKGRKANNVICFVWIAASLFLMVYTDLTAGAFAGAAAILSFCWYKYKSYKELGGITGDTAGYFVTICETAMVAATAIASLI